MADVIQTTRTLPRQALAAPRSRRRMWRGHLQGSEYAWALAFCVPYVAVFFAFVVYPVAFGIWMGSEPFLYTTLFSDPIYLKTVVNTALFLGIAINLKLFLALMLWRLSPRFGPLVPSPAPDRRSLLEHLSATGRFYSRQRRLVALLGIVRQDGLDLLAARAPETREQDGAARLRTAARLTGQNPRELLHAFSAGASTPHEFTLAMRVLASFRLALSGKPTRRRGRRRSGGSFGSDRRTDHKRRAQWIEALRGQREPGAEKLPRN